MTEANIAVTDLEFEPWPDVTICVNGSSSEPKHKIRWAVPVRRGQTIVLRRRDFQKATQGVSGAVEAVRTVRLVVPHHAVTRFDFSVQAELTNEQTVVSTSMQ